MKIAVVVDSGCAMSKEEAEKQGIFFLPLQIIDGETTYLDGIELTKPQLCDMLRNGKMFKTSLPPLNQIVELFQKLKDENYDHIIAVPLTSGISSTMSTLNMMAEDIGIDISCIETYSTAYLQRYIAESAKRLVDAGQDVETIVNKLNDCVAHSNTYLIVEDLDTLKRGGRLTPLAAALAGMLRIRPILKLNITSGGKVDTVSKVRTTSRAIKTAVDTIDTENEMNPEDYLVAILDADAGQVAAELQELYFGKYQEYEQVQGSLANVIICHTGASAVGIQYMKKIKE